MVDIAIVCEPFLPFSANKILGYFNLSDPGFNYLNIKLSTGAALGAPFYLFEKVEDEVIAKKLAELEEIRKSRMEKEQSIDNQQVEKVNPLKPTIAFEDFSKLDIRTGKITSAEKIQGADKLLKLNVDLGFEQRVIVSGIALHFTPEQLIGQQVAVLVNLAPCKMRGVESNGMILMAEDAQGKLHFVQTPDRTESGMPIS